MNRHRIISLTVCCQKNWTCILVRLVHRSPSENWCQPINPVRGREEHPPTYIFWTHFFHFSQNQKVCKKLQKWEAAWKQPESDSWRMRWSVHKAERWERNVREAEEEWAAGTKTPTRSAQQANTHTFSVHNTHIKWIKIQRWTFNHLSVSGSRAA